ncbi:hypothetical protein V8C44DRAFT_248860 [Trichoderma aethiopicum]
MHELLASPHQWQQCRALQKALNGLQNHLPRQLRISATHDGDSATKRATASGVFTRPIGDDERRLPGRPLQTDSPSSAFLLVTPITPIGGDESKLLDPLFRLPLLFPLQRQAKMLLIRSPYLHLESAQPNMSSHWVGSVNAPIWSARKILMITTIRVPVMTPMNWISATLRPWTMNSRSFSMSWISTILPHRQSQAILSQRWKLSELRIFPAAILIGQRLYTPYAEGH